MSEEISIRSTLNVFPLRLKSGTEIKGALHSFVKKNELKAAFILTCCGSVKKATLRYATIEDSKEVIETHDKYFEITSLVGTICLDGAHLHVTLGDSCGSTVSGHVIDLIVHTTAEIVLGEANDAKFSRLFDPSTGWSELDIQSNE